MTSGWAYGNEAADGRVPGSAAACYPVAVHAISRLAVGFGGLFPCVSGTCVVEPPAVGAGGDFRPQAALAFRGGDSNLYAYARENPLTVKDPSGLCLEDLCVGETIAAVELGEALWATAAGALAGVDAMVAGSMVNFSGGEGDRRLQPPAVSNTGDPGAIGPGGSCEPGSPGPNKRFTPDQLAPIDLAKEAKQLGGLSADDAQILQDWADELNVPNHGPETHPDRNFDIPHVHIGPIDHIPIK